MNFFFKKTNPKFITILTGGHLELTKKLALKLKKSINDEILITYKDFEIGKEKFYQDNENLKVFNCDLGNDEGLDDLLHYLKSFKIKRLIHCDHFIGSFNPLIETNYSELRKMIKINIEIPMILNSKLVKSSNFEKNAKVLQFLFPITDNIKTIPQFNSYKMISDSFKHMILCLREDLAINPVFFALSKIRFLEQNYVNILKDKNLLNQELMNTLYNCDSVINYIEFLLSEKVDPYKFGANIWDIEDQTNQSYWVKEKNKL